MNQTKQITNYGFRVSFWKRLFAWFLCPQLLILRFISIVKNVFFSVKNSKRVVIIEPFGMGDVLTHEPLVRALKENGYSVLFCGKEAWRDLIPQSNAVTWHTLKLPWTAKAIGDKYNLMGGFIQQLSNAVKGLKPFGRGSIGIDTRGDARSILLLHLIGCRKVYTLSHYIGSSMRNPHYGAIQVPQSSTALRWQQNLRFLHAMGLQPNNNLVDPPCLSHLLEQAKPDNRIGLIPLAATDGKYWPQEHWLELVQLLQKQGVALEWYCGPNQASEIENTFEGELKCTEIHSIRDWVSCLTGLKAVISVNTGPMHIAAALNLPLIVMDGSSTLPLWAPAGKKSLLIHHQESFCCAPCHQVGDAERCCNNECMRAVLPNEVAAGLFRLCT